jgi:hypothetical protein
MCSTYQLLSDVQGQGKIPDICNYERVMNFSIAKLSTLEMH